MDKSLKIAVILSAVDKMSSVVSSSVSKVENKLKSFSKTNKQIADKAFGFAGETAKLGLGAGALLVGPLKAAAEMEKMQVALKTAYGGSGEAADKAFTMINAFAAKTPYQLEEVMTAHVKLKNMGLDPTTKAMEAYGNTASAMGKSLNDMIEAVADAATGEFERLKEFGIRASQQGDKVTFTFKGVKTTVAKNSAAIEAYLKNIGNTHFAGGIEAQSKTLSGQLSTLLDNINVNAAAIGKTLIPVITQLFAKIQPIIDRIANWIQRNPELTKQILLGIAAFAALNLTLSLGAVVVGTFAKTLMVLSNVMKFTVSAIKLVGTVIGWLGRIMLTNPIGLAITAIAIAAFFIIKYWDQIKAFFARLWTAVKSIFLTTWNWIKTLFLNFTPAGLVMKHWGKITAFFSGLWNRVKGIFIGYVNWVLGLGGRFYQAGVNIVKSIWNGIKSMVNKPIEAIKGMVTKIRNFLPFSPAKEGPLRDIHRIKLVETIVQGIKVRPAIQAMQRVTSAMANPGGPSASPAASMVPVGGGNITIHFSPTIHGGGGNIMAELKKYEKDLLRLIEEAQRKAGRTKF